MNTSKFPEGILVTESPDSITFFDSQFRHYQARRDHPRFAQIVEALEDGDIDAAIDLNKPIQAIADLVDQIAADVNGESDSLGESFKWFRRRAGDLVVTDFGVTLDGVALHGYVIDQLLAFKREGLDFNPLLRFIVKLYQNPSSVARSELFLWLEKAEMPITPDGDFIAYKRIRNNYKDIHSGTFDNHVGAVCQMSRLEVDDDRTRTCSAGLHFCSRSYLPSFGSNGSADRVVLVKINPADVVSIPADHGDAKGRTWRYEVVGETTLEEAGLGWSDRVTSDYSDYDRYDDEDGVGDEYDWDYATQDSIDIGDVIRWTTWADNNGDPGSVVSLEVDRIAEGYVHGTATNGVGGKIFGYTCMLLDDAGYDHWQVLYEV